MRGVSLLDDDEGSRRVKRAEERRVFMDAMRTRDSVIVSCQNLRGIRHKGLNMWLLLVKGRTEDMNS